MSTPRHPPGTRLAALGLVLATSCYADVFHATDWETVCKSDPDAAGCADASSSGAGASGTGGAATSSSSATGGDGGAAGGPPAGACGNGVIDPGEQCDAGAQPGLGCSADCMVECAGQGEHVDPTTNVCYRFVDAVLLSWGQARDDCTAWDGDLAAITSEAEQAFVATLVASSAWIGGNDKLVEGTFVWSDGEPFGYTHWAPGEPNNANDAEDCIEVNVALGLQWNDNVCPDAKPHLCERRPAGM